MPIVDSPILRSKERINPYRIAARLIFDRLKWDLNIVSHSSRKKLKSIKGKYIGKKAVILCNGPSLNNVDFSLLNDVFTFGLNKINLLFDKSDFRPSAIVAVNSYVIDQNKKFYNSTDIPVFLDFKSHNIISNKKNIVFLHSSPIKTFARDAGISINQGGTVTFVAMQLAFHMGFSDVALVGCDHYFKSKGVANSLVSSEKIDLNHFDDKYFSGEQKWQLPDLAQSEYSYNLAKEHFETFGRKIYNCTDGGNLEIYERISLREFLK